MTEVPVIRLYGDRGVSYYAITNAASPKPKTLSILRRGLPFVPSCPCHGSEEPTAEASEKGLVGDVNVLGFGFKVLGLGDQGFGLGGLRFRV